MVGDRFLVRPGETVATDGEVETGQAVLDRSSMTGESMPTEVGPGDRVIGGTVAMGGRLVVRAESVGAETPSCPRCSTWSSVRRTRRRRRRDWPIGSPAISCRRSWP